MLSFQVKFYKRHHYRHFAKECTTVWRWKFEEQSKKEQSKEECENPIYEVDQINETRMLENVPKNKILLHKMMKSN